MSFGFVQHDRYASSADGTVGVGFFQQGHDIICGCGLAEKPAERLPAEIPEDRFHRVEVILGLILRAQQEEDRINRPLVEGVELDAAGTDANGNGKGVANAAALSSRTTR